MTQDLKTDHLEIRLGKLFFIAAVAFLIIRYNGYPWIIKRSSDVFFAASALLVLFHLVYRQSWQQFWRVSRKVAAGVILILGGIFLATSLSYAIDGIKINSETIIDFGRFLEAGVIAILAVFFQYFDKSFYKKAALAQLSTAVYFLILVFPQAKIFSGTFAMYRFQVFDNFPSSVGYYLIVSLSLVIVFLLATLSLERGARFKNLLRLVYYSAAVGLTAIIIWTQARAAWVGFLLALAVIVSVWIFRARGRVLANFLKGALIILSLWFFGFLILPTYARNEVVNRVFPEVRPIMEKEADFLATPTTKVVKELIAKKIPINFSEPSRPVLWVDYAKRIFSRPLGLGLNHIRSPYGNTLTGPHNTFLEILAMGGILALIGYGYLFYLFFRNVFRKIRGEADWRWPLYLLAAMAGLILAAQFDNMSTFRLMWVILGLGIYV